MGVHDLSGGAAVLADVEEAARRALRRYDVSPEATVRLTNVSENATFTVEDSGARAILRVHRLGYHSPQAIASELDWARALREDAGVRTPRVIPARDGSRIVSVASPGAGTRECVMFEFLPGGEPAQERLVEHMEPLGAVTARMHAHAREWARPPAFTRFHWDVEAAFGPAPRWGDWRDGAGVDGEARKVLARLEEVLPARLGRFGSGRERYGLIHADLRLANLLVDDEHGTSVIDFDDCGMGWYLYDFGAAVSFIEHDPRMPEMIDAWARGYRTVLDLPAADEAEIWTFVMFRRLLLVAWIGSHPAVDIARELGAGYTRGACDLADRYLTHFA
ncbi:aminoglycoside phosphotransferase [Planotetraspora thailandica]|uniref:Aminoglycoside phosphotransferase n=1 Tax=Planotetraspora thailandica TaxID=487172 RepID=A0A8J3VAR6_9ACTN|nr:phosphotransferase [Planotetraspora thailandica]GII57434.1 aminoglycoside phosphotransferase [Planotetraspora thailandica]